MGRKPLGNSTSLLKRKKMFSRWTGGGKQKQDPQKLAEKQTKKYQQISTEMTAEQVYKMLYPSPKELLLTPRVLVKTGMVLFIVTGRAERKPRYLFLFNDVLLVTRREGKKEFRLRFYIYLTSKTFCEQEPKSDVAVVVRTSKKTCQFICKSTQERDEWLQSIQGSLEGKYDPNREEIEVEKEVQVETEVVTTEEVDNKSNTFTFGDFDVSDLMDENLMDDVGEISLADLSKELDEEVPGFDDFDRVPSDSDSETIIIDEPEPGDERDDKPESNEDEDKPPTNEEEGKPESADPSNSDSE